jgi:O-antigen ligase
MARTAGAFGHGPGSFKMLLPASPLLSNALLSRWVLQPRIIPGFQISMWSMAHNDYLQTWVEFGWLGLILSSAILFGGVASAITRIRGKLNDLRRPDGFILLGVSAALLGVMVHALFDFPLQIASIQVTMIVLLGICWGTRLSERRNPAHWQFANARFLSRESAVRV